MISILDKQKLIKKLRLELATYEDNMVSRDDFLEQISSILIQSATDIKNKRVDDLAKMILKANRNEIREELMPDELEYFDGKYSI